MLRTSNQQLALLWLHQQGLLGKSSLLIFLINTSRIFSDISLGENDYAWARFDYFVGTVKHKLSNPMVSLIFVVHAKQLSKQRDFKESYTQCSRKYNVFRIWKRCVTDSKSKEVETTMTIPFNRELH